MNKPFAPASGVSERARAVRDLRRAIDAARLEAARIIAREGSLAAAEARTLLQRLEEIGRELDRMRGLNLGLQGVEAHPFWIDSLRSGCAR